jgi:hypothetical protein
MEEMEGVCQAFDAAVGLSVQETGFGKVEGKQTFLSYLFSCFKPDIRYRKTSDNERLSIICYAFKFY